MSFVRQLVEGPLRSKWVRGGLAALVLSQAYKLLTQSPRRSLKGKCVLVTGAANGVGRLIAMLLAAKGARLVLWDIQAEALAQTVADITARHYATGPVEVLSYVCDLSKRQNIFDVADRTKADCQAK